MSTLDTAITTLTTLQSHITQQTAAATAAATAHNFAEAARIIDAELIHAAGQRALAQLARTESKKNYYSWVWRDPKFNTLDDLERTIAVAYDAMNVSKGQYTTSAEIARQAAVLEAARAAAAEQTARAAAEAARAAQEARVEPPVNTRVVGARVAPEPLISSNDARDYLTALNKLTALTLQDRNPDVNALLHDLINQVKHLKNAGEMKTIDLIVVLNSTYDRLTTGNRSQIAREIYEDIAKTMQGHSSPARRALGYTMLALSLAVAIAGVIFIPHIVGTAAVIACGSGVGITGLATAIASICFFAANRPTGLSKAMLGLNKKMSGQIEYAPVTEQAPAAAMGTGV